MRCDKVKIIQCVHIEPFERQINSFINQSHVKVEDIQYETMRVSDKHYPHRYSALVKYKDTSKEGKSEG